MPDILIQRAPHQRSGQASEFPQRDTIFIANLLAMFFGNEEETQMLSKVVGRVDSYGGRLIPIVDILFGGGSNFLVLEREPDPELCRYFQDSLLLSIPEVEILSHREYLEINRKISEGSHPFLERLASHQADWIDGFVTDNTLEAYRAK